MITQERLKELLSYDPLTGVFLWKVARRRGGYAGEGAGSKNSKGYTVIRVDGKLYKAHRLAWLFVYGDHPNGEIDHKNMDKADNRISNLRTATRSQNRSNVRAYRNNSSGQKGVSPLRGKWQATISINGIQKYLGLFESRSEATAVYAKAAKSLHGSFARVA